MVTLGFIVSIHLTLSTALIIRVNIFKVIIMNKVFVKILLTNLKTEMFFINFFCKRNTKQTMICPNFIIMKLHKNDLEISLIQITLKK